MAIHRRSGDVPRSTIVDLEQPGVQEDEPLGCSVPFNVVDELLGETLRVVWPNCAVASNASVSPDVHKKLGLVLAGHQQIGSRKARTSLILGAHAAYRD
jgi:hypothetical protein